LYIENTGSEPVHDFICYYYFTADASKDVILEGIDSPGGAEITLEELDDPEMYRIKYDYTDVTIPAQGRIPETGGNSVTLRYSDDSQWDKSDDPSYSTSDPANFTVNRNIPVYQVNGAAVDGIVRASTWNEELALDHINAGKDVRIDKEYYRNGYKNAGASAKYRITDHLGTTRMFVDNRGDVKQSYDYTPYGVMHTLYTDADDRAVKLFTGKEFDDEGQDTENGGSGIQSYHFKFRTYDPEIGVWLSTDPKMQDWNG